MKTWCPPSPPPHLCLIPPSWAFPSTSIHRLPPPTFPSHSPEFPLGCIFKDSSHRLNQQFYRTASYCLYVYVLHQMSIFHIKYQNYTQKITKIDSFSPKLELNMIEKTLFQLKFESIRRTCQCKFNRTFVDLSE